MNRNLFTDRIKRAYFRMGLIQVHGCSKTWGEFQIYTLKMECRLAQCDIRQWKIKQNIWLINSINWMITIYFSCYMCAFFVRVIIFNLNGMRAPPIPLLFLISPLLLRILSHFSTLFILFTQPRVSPSANWLNNK